MRYFDAMRSKSCSASLTAHETQHKTCNQLKMLLLGIIDLFGSTSIFDILQAIY